MANRIILGNLVIDRDRYDVWVGGQRIDLTYVEFELLFRLARSAGTVVSPRELLEAAWDDEEPADTKKLRVHISRLRKKIKGSQPFGIRTTAKRGYSLSDSGGNFPRPRATGAAGLLSGGAQGGSP